MCRMSGTTGRMRTTTRVKIIKVFGLNGLFSVRPVFILFLAFVNNSFWDAAILGRIKTGSDIAKKEKNVSGILKNYFNYAIIKRYQ